MNKLNWVDDGYFVTERRDIRNIRRVLLITMLLNFVATAVKLSAGVATGSISVIADSLDSLFDGLSNVVGLAGLYASSKPPDAEHPYGHRKFETIAALSIAFLLFLTCLQLVQTAWTRFEEHVTPQINIWVLIAMLISMGIQAVTSIYELRQGRRLHSELLVADALHTRASIFVSASVLVGLGLVWLGYPQADPLLAVFVAFMIAKIGIDILRETLPVLVDQAAVDPNRIAQVVREVQGVLSFHRVRSRGAEGSAAVDLHVRISPEKTVQEADAIASEVRRRLLELEGVNDVTVHLESQRGPAPDAADLFGVLKHTANGLGLTVHESWAHRLDGNLIIEVHLGVDPCLTLGQAHDLVDTLEREMRVRFPEVDHVHTHIEMATTSIQDGHHVSEVLETWVHQEIEQVISVIPEVQFPHNIQVHAMEGEPDGYYISLECTIDPQTPIADAHRLSDLIEHELSRRLEGVVDVFVHLEPPEQA